MTFSLDQPVTLTFRTYSDSARTNLADATTVTLDILKPDGTVTTVTLAAAQVVRDSLGTYHYAYTPAAAGHYAYHWKSTGTVTTAGDGSFDVEAKYDAEFISVAEIRSHMEDDTLDADQLQVFIDAATRIIARLGGATVPGAITEDWTCGGDTIILDHPPVSTITSVTEYNGGVAQVIAAEPIDTATFTSYGYRLDSAAGLILRLSGGYPATWRGNVRVVYLSGASVTGEVKFAALECVRLLWSKAKGMGATEYPVSLSSIDLDYIANILGGRFPVIT